MELSRVRHSLSHILAQAVLEVFPDAVLGTGPDTDTGFYYDFALPRNIEPSDLKTIEKKMQEIIKRKLDFTSYSLPIDEAIAMLKEKGQRLKVEIVEDLAKDGETTVSFYKTGDQFEDLCAGPHIENTSQITKGSFKLNNFSAAYWRADETRDSMQRIYGLAFEDSDTLKAHIHMLEEAKKRDHKVLGPQLGLFTNSPLIGAGLPLMQPKGMIIRQAIEDYLWELHKKKGYNRVCTPHIAKESLYETSGHAAKFGDELFRVQGKEDSFILKPMNCPHHMQIFADNQFSYRDMPIRYFEPATVYRDEKSGQLGGLTRVRAITQDDGHLFCRLEQIKEEVTTITDIISQFYKTFGMDEDYWVSLSVRGDDRSKYLGEDDVWEKAEDALQQAAEASKLPYKRIEGEAAFYGPKLDFMFKDAIGREWQLATIQCDFNLPERFDLSYINENNEKERPVVIHRAISGSLERFMGMIIEHFVGAFPTWLAPEQVAILPVNDVHNDFCDSLEDKLRDMDVRVVRLDASQDSLGKRIRWSEKQKIPYMLVIGDKEVESDSLAVRHYRSKEQTELSTSEFLSSLQTEINDRILK